MCQFKAASRKGILYENVKMLSPEGQMLSFLSVKKANWYVNKDLAGCVFFFVAMVTKNI